MQKIANDAILRKNADAACFSYHQMGLAVEERML